MPMLPSGRHIATDSRPLDLLLEDAANPSNVHRIMAIETVDDLFPWIELIEFVPEAEATAEQRERALPRADGFPDGLLPFRTGRRLSDWTAFAADWTEDDRKAMAAFVDERARPYYASEVDRSRRVQDALLASFPSLPGMLAHMWRARCHPLQDEPAIDHELPPQGTYARLAALVYARRLVAAHPNLTADHLDAGDRVAGFVATCESAFAFPEPVPDESVAEYADRLATLDPLGDLEPDKRAWYDRQSGLECVSLWNAAGEELKTIDRATCDIVELAVTSGARRNGF